MNGHCVILPKNC